MPFQSLWFQLNSLSFSNLKSIWKLVQVLIIAHNPHYLLFYHFLKKMELSTKEKEMKMRHILHSLIGVFHLD